MTPVINRRSPSCFDPTTRRFLLRSRRAHNLLADGARKSPKYFSKMVAVMVQEPFAMLTDLWIKHRDWVFEPIHYSSLDKLVGALDKEIIGPAEVRCHELLIRKAEKMKGTHV